MKYGNKNIDNLKRKINDEKFLVPMCRKRDIDFSRNRKLKPKDLVLYNINNRGKTTKMELNDFLEKCNMDDVSDVALLKQREKLNEEVFVILNNESMIDFYNNYKDEVKTFKGYVLLAIDGSDCEVEVGVNWELSEKCYQINLSGGVACNVSAAANTGMVVGIPNSWYITVVGEEIVSGETWYKITAIGTTSTVQYYDCYAYAGENSVYAVEYTELGGACPYPS